MKIAVVSSFYSKDMGYTENCLPKALAALGHEVQVLTSNWNVYGTSAEYNSMYGSHLGPADEGVGVSAVDGYTVRRLPSRIVRGYILLRGLARALRAFDPDVVHSIEIASLPTFQAAVLWPFARYRLFTETHQHLSVVKPFLRKPGGRLVQMAVYRATRTLPTFLSSLAVDRCYAIAPDCMEVARRYYGVPQGKLTLQSLGTDTELFRPALTVEHLERRAEMRRIAGFHESDIVCVYTGRLTPAKNPLVLAQAVDLLAHTDSRFKGLFIGDGMQSQSIRACAGTTIRPFVKYRELADIYRMADIAVWPRQESMSMLDAAATGLPLVVSGSMGEAERASGSGRTYEENNPADLARVLTSLQSMDLRRDLGMAGRRKMAEHFSWAAIARQLTADYVAAGARR